MASTKVLPRIIDSICLLLILIFLYAAYVKGTDLTLFKNQMMQSPLIPTTVISELAIFVPVSELVICLLLFFERTRKLGLLLSYCTMLMFSIYMITLVLFFGDNIPCACGGILGKMGYTAHIIFNIMFTLLSLFGFLKIRKNEPKKMV